MTKPLGIKLMSNPIIKRLRFNHSKQLVNLTTSECDSLRYNGIKIHGKKGNRKKGGG